MAKVDRRSFLRSAVALASTTSLVGSLDDARAAGPALQYGPPRSFTFDALAARAKAMAAKAYVVPYRPRPDIVGRIDYEAHGKIRFKPDLALFAQNGAGYPVTFFHLGQYFRTSVKMFAVAAGQAREILYSPDYFEMPADSIARRLPKDSGFAGFRLQESARRRDWRTQDWLAFLGASYFRAIGALEQYGLSARGIVVDTTAATPEEFPEFLEYYIEPAASDGDPVVVSALLDGPSVSGAYRFACHRTTGVVMEVTAALFVRKTIAQLGVAPLTSMFWYSEYDRGFRSDWRPEVHDSDGLAMWTGSGERIWRPLNDPSRTVTSSFLDTNPKGFGLLQRDRYFEHYLDGVNYDLRPSLWVEPLGDFGAGSVTLVEIPTDDEIHDNVVAFWVPKTPATAGTSYRFNYRLHWLADEPYPATNLASVVATRFGRGGEPGKPRPKDVTRFVVEFAGKPLEGIRSDEKLVAVVTASRGDVSLVTCEPIPHGTRWRAQFDLTLHDAAPTELRAYLRMGAQTLTETWLYQFEPRATPS